MMLTAVETLSNPLHSLLSSLLYAYSRAVFVAVLPIYRGFDLTIRL